MLDLVLEKNAKFRHAALKNGRAEIEFAAEVEAKDAVAPSGTEGEPDYNPGSPAVEHKDAVKAEGVFRLMNTGNAVDAVITANGKLAEAVTAEPKDIKVTLTADATIKVAFAEGELTVDTGIIWEEENGSPSADPSSVKPALITTAHAARDDDKHPYTLRLTRAGDAATAKACRIDVTFPGVEVATGCGRDRNCNGPLTINGVGEVHVDALCNWEKYRGLKANPTHFRIRAVNSHAKIYSIGVNDPDTEAVDTSGE